MKKHSISSGLTLILISTLTAASVSLGAPSASAAGASANSDPLPAGSTIELTDLGNGKPGESLPGEVTVTAPDDTFDTDPGTPGVQGDADNDRDPVVDRSVELSLDHGFFTDGPALPTTIGAPAGDLTDLGPTLTAVTDGNGEVEFEIGIGRDTGFDFSPEVTATLTAMAGDLSETGAAGWDSTNPFNGGAVQIVLSPADEQVHAVDPAVSGDRTYYDVVTTDQFGNPVVGEPVELDYSGDLDDWDYSEDFVESDLDRSGDFWVVSFEAAAIDVASTWNAPTTTYTDTAGSTTSGFGDLMGSATATFYDLDFDAARFSLRSSPGGKVGRNSPVTQIVRVIDHLGNPVRGYKVRFFRNGPDTDSSEPRASRITNAQGRAFYTFVGTEVGKARITAEVTDGQDIRTLRNTVRFDLPVRAKLRAGGSRGPNDRVTVRASRVAAGAKVKLFRIVNGKRRSAGKTKLNSAGMARFTVRDRNGRQRTAYFAKVKATSTTVSATTNRLWLR